MGNLSVQREFANIFADGRLSENEKLQLFDLLRRNDDALRMAEPSKSFENVRFIDEEGELARKINYELSILNSSYRLRGMALFYTKKDNPEAKSLEKEANEKFNVSLISGSPADSCRTIHSSTVYFLPGSETKAYDSFNILEAKGANCWF